MKKLTIGLVFVLTLIMFTFSFASAAQYSMNGDPHEIEKRLAKEKGLNLSQIDILIDNGYTYKMISEMSQLEIVQILGSNSFQTSEITPLYTGPSGYTQVDTVPYDGGTDEWFHPDADTTETTIDDVCTEALFSCRNIFNTGLSFDDILFSYYMFGEDYESKDWTHEGCDFKNVYDSEAWVYSPITGKVVLADPDKKWISIYNSNMGITMNFQHLNNILVNEDEWVYIGDELGQQNTDDNHVHVQVCDHTSCKTVHSGQDRTLRCIKPWAYLH